MKIFVTGGAGYVGSVCVEHLISKGYDVAVFDNLSEGHRAAIHPAATFYHNDLANVSELADCIAAFSPDAVMHFAANALVGESMQEPTKYFRNNVAGGLNLLDAMVRNGVGKIVFSSTCATFGQPDKLPIDESMPQRPINPYGESKLMFEKLLQWYDRIHGIKHVALRYFNVAGASADYGEDHRVETHLIPNVLKVALGVKSHVEVYGDDFDTPDGSCIRDYVHILDLAQAHYLALSTTDSVQYNLGTGGGTSVFEVVDCCREITGCEIPVEIKPRRPGDPARLIAGSDKIRSELNWSPQYQSIAQIVESAWRWHQQFPAGYGD